MKKNFKHVGVIIGFLVLIYFSNSFLRYLLIDDVYSYTRVMLHEMYKQDSNIDTLFLGSSHCYHSLNTKITDEIFKQNTFNAGSSAQYLDGTYYLLKEAEKTNNIQQVFIELYYGQQGLVTKERSNLISTYLISDYMKPSLNRVAYLLQASNTELYVNSFILPRRNSKKIFDMQYMTSILQQKSTEAYKNYEYIVWENEQYEGKGYVNTKTQVDLGSYVHDGGFAQIKEMSEDDINNLNKIIEFCEQKDIKVTFFSSPMSDYRLVSLENYDDFVNQMNNFFSSKGLEYYDFNLCKREYLDLKETDFMDDNHLNGTGADKFSKVFSLFFNGAWKKNELFYNTYKEKIEVDQDIVYGIILDSLESPKTFSIRPITSDAMKLKYTISKKSNSNETIELLQDKNENTKIVLPIDETGELYIDVFKTNETEPSNSVSFKY